MKTNPNAKILPIAAIIIAAVLSRLIPGQTPNFNPVLAVAIFGGAYIADKRLAYLLPILTMFLSDLYIQLHPTMLGVYTSVALSVFIGTKISEKLSAVRIGVASLASAVVFYAVTNLAWWPFMYSLDFEGLFACYVAGLEFFRYSIAGNLFYAAVIFGAYNLALRHAPNAILNKASN